MKLNVANPATGAQKLFDFEDERKVRVFMEKRMGQEVAADSLGDEWKGYVTSLLAMEGAYVVCEAMCSRSLVRFLQA